MIIIYKNSYFDKVLIQRQLLYCLFQGTVQALSNTETIAVHQSELSYNNLLLEKLPCSFSVGYRITLQGLKLLWQFWAVKQLLAFWYLMLLYTLN